MNKMTTYTFMPADKVHDLDMLLNGLEDYIFGDLEGRKLTENRMKELSDKFTEIDQIIRSCKKKEEDDRTLAEEYKKISADGEVLIFSVKVGE